LFFLRKEIIINKEIKTEESLSKSHKHVGFSKKLLIIKYMLSSAFRHWSGIVFLFVISLTQQLNAQIDNVRYLLKYNPFVDEFDMYIYIAGGSATSIARRSLINT
jgi:hypothetical protein